MLPTDFEGNNPTIENVFHSLNTRLNFIKTGIAKLGKYYDGSDYECNPNEIIYEIQSKVHGYNCVLALGEIENSLALIDRIQIAIDEIPEKDEIVTTDSWSVANTYNPNFKDELNQYKYILEELKEVLLSKESSMIANSEFNLKKIKLNIKVEELAGLIYFLYEDEIFKSKLKPLCRAITGIFSQSTGDNFEVEYLYNQVFECKDDGPIITFWRDKFIDYVNLSNTLQKKKK